MPKTNNAKRKRPTHFEQVPLKVVKKIAAADVPENDITTTGQAGADPIPTKTTAESVPGRTSRRDRR